VKFGDVEAPVIISSDDFVVARVPEGAGSGPVIVSTNGHASNAHQVRVAAAIADNLHPVTNPAIDAEGNIYVTFSGSRGQKVPVAIFKIDTNYNLKPFLAEMMNATAIAFDREGEMYVTSRYDGTVYKIGPNATMSTYAEGMGVATGMAFDQQQNLYVGDRSGTVFKIGRDRQIFVFATLEPSVSAYHMAFGPTGDLYVTGPTTSSFDSVYRIDPHGTVSVFYRGLGRPQGLAFDASGNLYVAASLSGKRGIVKITPRAEAALEVAVKTIAGDNQAHLASVAETALSRADVVIFMGGLGPTEDDLTREAVADALGLELRRDQEIISKLEQRFASHKLKMSPNNAKQADVIAGATVLPNALGTAPGQWLSGKLDGRERIIILLPGPPHELKALFTDQCVERLKKKLPRTSLATRVLKIAMMGESQCDARVAPLYQRYPDVQTTILAGAGEIQLHFKAHAETLEAAQARVDEVAEVIEGELGDFVYSDQGESLEQIVGYYLQMR